MPTSPKSHLPAPETNATAKAVTRSKEELASDRNARRNRRAFKRMGNKFYKDPDLEMPQECRTSTEISDQEREDTTKTIDDMPEASRSKPAVSSRKPVPDEKPLNDIIEAQNKITLMIVKNDVAEFLQAILTDSYMLHVKKGGALPPNKSLVFYSGEPAHMLELSRYVDVALRDTIRPMTISPNGGTKDVIPAESEDQEGSLVEVAPEANQRVVVKHPLENGTLIVTTDAAQVIMLACTAGALAASIILASDISGFVVAVANLARRVLYAVDGARIHMFRRVCLVIYDILGVVVSKLVDFHGKLAEFASGR